MENCNILSEYIKKNEFENIKMFIKNTKLNLNDANCIGDPPLHYAVRLSQVAYSNKKFNESQNYQKIADFLISNGASLSIKNEFNDIVSLNPEYKEENVSSYNNSDDWSDDFFSDTQINTDNTRQLGGVMMNDTQHDQLSYDQVLSDQVVSDSIDFDNYLEEQLGGNELDNESDDDIVS